MTNSTHAKPAETRVDDAMPFQSHVIPAGNGYALQVKNGQLLRVTDLEGQQVTDLLAFDAGDVTHRFSRAQTKKLNARIWISSGNILYSNLCRPMLRIRRDTVGKHDMQFSPCGPDDNLVRFGEPGTKTCIGNFMDVLFEFKITRDAMCEPFGIFFNLEIDSAGRCTTQPPLSKAGDFVELEACMDLLVGLSACPQLFNCCNGYKPTPVRVDVFAPVPRGTQCGKAL